MSLPKRLEALQPSGYETKDSETIVKLKEALTIAWEALEQNVEFNMRDAEGPELRAQNEGNYRRSKEALRRIEEIGK